MNNTLKNLFLPKVLGESLYIPFVGAIIEKKYNGERYILVQTRQKITDPAYSGTLEIPGGKFRAFEDIFETLEREVGEETGLEITKIKGKEKTCVYKNRNDESNLIEPFCVTQMKNGPFIGIIFICEAKGNLAKKTNETKDIRWTKVSDLKNLVKTNPEKIYTAFLAPLKKYLG